MRVPASAYPHPRPCKICRKPAPLIGVVDFNKNCEEHRGLNLPLSGYAIYYRRCVSCDFLFTDYFDDWDNNEFRSHIYNAEYVNVDPDFVSARPLGNARFLIDLFGRQASSLSVLDFGGGNGQLGASLRTAGFMVADTYDPFMPPHDQLPTRRYNIITCFETLEHSRDPTGSAAEIAGYLEDDGLIIMSTLVQPTEFSKVGLSWWYVGPRNGHISLQSYKSLAHLWASMGFSIVSRNANIHIAFRKIPPFAKNVIIVK